MTDDRSLAQYFFEQGFWSCFAEAMAANDGVPPFEITDKMMERCWQNSAIARDDYADFDARLALAKAAPDAVAALRWLRAFWRPGSDHDTQEVQHALAAADAALAAAQPKEINQ